MSNRSYLKWPIIFNSSNIVSGSNNSLLRYQFPGNGIYFKNSSVALGNISIYYSNFNISAAYNNNTFSYIWNDNAGSTTVNLTLPDGSYSISDINSYLQSSMISNGYYLVNTNSQNVYYLEIITNATYYAVQVNAYALPSSLPSGWTNGGGISFGPTDTPQIVINSNAFQDIIGFTAGTYPSVIQTTNYTVISTFTPQVSPVASYILLCSLVSNSYSLPNTVLFSFAPNVSFGELMVIQPPEFLFTDIKEGLYSYIDIQIVDQNFNQVSFQDSNTLIQLNLETPRK